MNRVVDAPLVVKCSSTQTSIMSVNGCNFLLVVFFIFIKGLITTSLRTNEVKETSENYVGGTWKSTRRHGNSISLTRLDSDSGCKVSFSTEIDVNLTQTQDLNCTDVCNNCCTDVCNNCSTDVNGSSNINNDHQIKDENVKDKLTRNKRDLSATLLHRGVIRVVEGIQWQDELLHRDSTAFMNLHGMFTELFDGIFANSQFSERYIGTIIEEVRKGSVVVNFAVVWNTNTTSDMDEDTLNAMLLQALQNASGQFNLTVDTDNTQIDGTQTINTTDESALHYLTLTSFSEYETSSTAYNSLQYAPSQSSDASSVYGLLDYQHVSINPTDLKSFLFTSYSEQEGSKTERLDHTSVYWSLQYKSIFTEISVIQQPLSTSFKEHGSSGFVQYGTSDPLIDAYETLEYQRSFTDITAINPLLFTSYSEQESSSAEWKDDMLVYSSLEYHAASIVPSDSHSYLPAYSSPEYISASTHTTVIQYVQSTSSPKHEVSSKLYSFEQHENSETIDHTLSYMSHGYKPVSTDTTIMQSEISQIQETLSRGSAQPTTSPKENDETVLTPLTSTHYVNVPSSIRSHRYELLSSEEIRYTATPSASLLSSTIDESELIHSSDIPPSESYLISIMSNEPMSFVPFEQQSNTLTKQYTHIDIQTMTYSYSSLKGTSFHLLPYTISDLKTTMLNADISDSTEIADLDVSSSTRKRYSPQEQTVIPLEERPFNSFENSFTSIDASLSDHTQFSSNFESILSTSYDIHHTSLQNDSSNKFFVSIIATRTLSDDYKEISTYGTLMASELDVVNLSEMYKNIPGSDFYSNNQSPQILYTESNFLVGDQLSEATGISSHLISTLSSSRRHSTLESDNALSAGLTSLEKMVLNFEYSSELTFEEKGSHSQFMMTYTDVDYHFRESSVATSEISKSSIDIQATVDSLISRTSDKMLDEASIIVYDSSITDVKQSIVSSLDVFTEGFSYFVTDNKFFEEVTSGNYKPLLNTAGVIEASESNSYASSVVLPTQLISLSTESSVYVPDSSKANSYVSSVIQPTKLIRLSTESSVYIAEFTEGNGYFSSVVQPTQFESSSIASSVYVTEASDSNSYVSSVVKPTQFATLSIKSSISVIEDSVNNFDGSSVVQPTHFESLTTKASIHVIENLDSKSNSLSFQFGGLSSKSSIQVTEISKTNRYVSSVVQPTQFPESKVSENNSYVSSVVQPTQFPESKVSDSNSFVSLEQTTHSDSLSKVSFIHIIEASESNSNVSSDLKPTQFESLSLGSSVHEIQTSESNSYVMPGIKPTKSASKSTASSIQVMEASNGKSYISSDVKPTKFESLSTASSIPKPSDAIEKLTEKGHIHSSTIVPSSPKFVSDFHATTEVTSIEPSGSHILQSGMTNALFETTTFTGIPKIASFSSIDTESVSFTDLMASGVNLSARGKLRDASIAATGTSGIISVSSNSFEGLSVSKVMDIDLSVSTSDGIHEHATRFSQSWTELSLNFDSASQRSAVFGDTDKTDTAGQYSTAYTVSPAEYADVIDSSNVFHSSVYIASLTNDYFSTIPNKKTSTISSGTISPSSTEKLFTVAKSSISYTPASLVENSSDLAEIEMVNILNESSDVIKTQLPHSSSIQSTDTVQLQSSGSMQLSENRDIQPSERSSAHLSETLDLQSFTGNSIQFSDTIEFHFSATTRSQSSEKLGLQLPASFNIQSSQSTDFQQLSSSGIHALGTSSTSDSIQSLEIVSLQPSSSIGIQASGTFESFSSRIPTSNIYGVQPYSSSSFPSTESLNMQPSNNRDIQSSEMFDFQSSGNEIIQLSDMFGLKSSNNINIQSSNHIQLQPYISSSTSQSIQMFDFYATADQLIQSKETLGDQPSSNNALRSSKIQSSAHTNFKSSEILGLKSSVSISIQTSEALQVQSSSSRFITETLDEQSSFSSSDIQSSGTIDLQPHANSRIQSSDNLVSHTFASSGVEYYKTLDLQHYTSGRIQQLALQTHASNSIQSSKTFVFKLSDSGNIQSAETLEVQSTTRSSIESSQRLDLEPFVSSSGQSPDTFGMKLSTRNNVQSSETLDFQSTGTSIHSSELFNVHSSESSNIPTYASSSVGSQEILHSQERGDFYSLHTFEPQSSVEGSIPSSYFSTKRQTALEILNVQTFVSYSLQFSEAQELHPSASRNIKPSVMLSMHLSTYSSIPFQDSRDQQLSATIRDLSSETLGPSVGNNIQSLESLVVKSFKSSRSPSKATVQLQAATSSNIQSSETHSFHLSASSNFLSPESLEIKPLVSSSIVTLETLYLEQSTSSHTLSLNTPILHQTASDKVQSSDILDGKPPKSSNVQLTFISTLLSERGNSHSSGTHDIHASASINTLSSDTLDIQQSTRRSILSSDTLDVQPNDSSSFHSFDVTDVQPPTSSHIIQKSKALILQTSQTIKSGSLENINVQQYTSSSYQSVETTDLHSSAISRFQTAAIYLHSDLNGDIKSSDFDKMYSKQSGESALGIISLSDSSMITTYKAQSAYETSKFLHASNTFSSDDRKNTFTTPLQPVLKPSSAKIYTSTVVEPIVMSSDNENHMESESFTEQIEIMSSFKDAFYKSTNIVLYQSLLSDSFLFSKSLPDVSDKTIFSLTSSLQSPINTRITKSFYTVDSMTNAVPKDVTMSSLSSKSASEGGSSINSNDAFTSFLPKLVQSKTIFDSNTSVIDLTVIGDKSATDISNGYDFQSIKQTSDYLFSGSRSALDSYSLTSSYHDFRDIESHGFPFESSIYTDKTDMDFSFLLSSTFNSKPSNVSTLDAEFPNTMTSVPDIPSEMDSLKTFDMPSIASKIKERTSNQVYTPLFVTKDFSIIESISTAKLKSSVMQIKPMSTPFIPHLESEISSSYMSDSSPYGPFVSASETTSSYHKQSNKILQSVSDSSETQIFFEKTLTDSYSQVSAFKSSLKEEISVESRTMSALTEETQRFAHVSEQPGILSSTLNLITHGFSDVKVPTLFQTPILLTSENVFDGTFSTVYSPEQRVSKTTNVTSMSSIDEIVMPAVIASDTISSDINGNNSISTTYVSPSAETISSSNSGDITFSTSFVGSAVTSTINTLLYITEDDSFSSSLLIFQGATNSSNSANTSTGIETGHAMEKILTSSLMYGISLATSLGTSSYIAQHSTFTTDTDSLSVISKGSLESHIDDAISTTGIYSEEISATGISSLFSMSTIKVSTRKNEMQSYQSPLLSSFDEESTLSKIQSESKSSHFQEKRTETNLRTSGLIMTQFVEESKLSVLKPTVSLSKPTGTATYEQDYGNVTSMLQLKSNSITMDNVLDSVIISAISVEEMTVLPSLSTDVTTFHKTNYVTTQENGTSILFLPSTESEVFYNTEDDSTLSLYTNTLKATDIKSSLKSSYTEYTVSSLTPIVTTVSTLFDGTSSETYLSLTKSSLPSSYIESSYSGTVIESTSNIILNEIGSTFSTEVFVYTTRSSFAEGETSMADKQFSATVGSFSSYFLHTSASETTTGENEVLQDTTGSAYLEVTTESSNAGVTTESSNFAVSTYSSYEGVTTQSSNVGVTAGSGNLGLSTGSSHNGVTTESSGLGVTSDDGDTTKINAVVVTDESWNEDLNDPTSATYKQKIEDIKLFLLYIISNSDLAAYVSDIIILGFSPGSVVVRFEVLLVPAPYEVQNMKDMFNDAYKSVFDPKYIIKDEFTEFKVEDIIQQSERVTTTDYCASNPCGPNSTCSYKNGTVFCECTDGLVYNGTQCVDIDECYTSPCMPNSLCTNTHGSYLCTCMDGFFQENNSCIDINECSSSPCPPHSSCLNTVGSFTCNCNAGYMMEDGLCKDINECLDYPCPAHADCSNIEGSFLCTCRHGFVESNNLCEDINECNTTDVCLEHSTCFNIDGSYYCLCHQGYSMQHQTCQDVNECINNVCPSHSTCTNTNGSYVCQCVTGLVQLSGTCNDINECLGNVCPTNSDCTNTFGSFYCECKEGYNMDNGSCIDIDECLYDVCPLNSNCTNSDGSYTCNCHGGYVDTGSSCIDINECQGIDICPSMSSCTNTDGSYKCDCYTGYHYVNNTCIDENECETVPCPVNAECINIPGSFICSCNEGYFMRNSTCEDINECENDNDCPVYSKCINYPGGYQCVCPDRYYPANPYICTEALVYSMTLRIIAIENDSASFTPDLEDIDGEKSLYLSDMLQSTMYWVMTSGEVFSYLGMKVFNYEEGSILAQSFIYFNVSSNVTDNQIYLLVRNQNYSEYITIDWQSTNISDIDECIDPSWNDCSENSSCLNLPGIFFCDCNEGYLDISKNTMLPGRTCADECLYDVCPLNSNCTNSDGSCTCNCHGGYVDTGSSCIVISDEHKDPISGLKVESSNDFSMIGRTVVYTLSIERGSHVSYLVNYGNGDTDSGSFPVLLAFKSPVQISHKYNEEANYTVTFTVYNDVSSSIASVTQVVQPSVQDIILIMEQNDPSYPGYMTLRVLPSKDKSYHNIHMYWEFGPSNTLYTYSEELSGNRSKQLHHYYDIGVHNFILNISNMVDYVIINKTFQIEEPIIGLIASCNKYIIQPGQQLFLHLETLNGSYIEYEISYGNDNIEYYSVYNGQRGPSNVYIPFTYAEIGAYDLNVLAYNSISNGTAAVAQTIFVQNPIRDIAVEIPPVIAAPPGDIILMLLFNGEDNPPSHLLCYISLNGTLVDSIYIEKMDVTVPSQMNTGWLYTDSVGEIEIEVNCSNQLSTDVVYAWTLIQKPVESVEITVDRYFIPIGGNVSFLFTIGSGSHTKYSITFDDGYINTGVVDSESDIFSTYQIMTSHVFNQKGFYKVLFDVNNLISQKVAILWIGVLEEVKGLKLTRFYYISDVKSEISLGHGPNSDFFPLERDIVFNTSLVTGNNVTYQWNFGDGLSEETMSGLINHRYLLIGTYIVTVNCSNALYFDTRTIDVTVQQTILPYQLKNDGPTKAYLTMVFTLELSRPGTNSCYIWDMGDGSRNTAYGNECKSFVDVDNYNYKTWFPVSVLSHTHMYRNNDTFNVNVRGINQVSAATITNIAIITGISCYYPVVHLNGGGQQVDRPVTHLRTDWIGLECTVDINCEASSTIGYNWTVYKIEQGQNFLDFVYKKYPVSSISTSDFNILFPPRTFIDGHYKVSMNASIVEIPGLFTEGYTYLNITKTSLVLGLLGGNARAVGYDNVFEMNAVDYSYDPDVDNPENKSYIIIEFLCRKLGENYPSKIDDIVIPSVEDSYNMTRSEGCFGTGIGKLPITDGRFQINSLLFEPNSENLFDVTMRKDKRISTMQQIIRIVEGRPKQFQIRCLVNCNSKMNPSGEFSLLSSCLDCHVTDKITHRWSLYIYNTTNEYELVRDLEDIVTTGTEGSAIAFRSQVLIGGRTYRLQLDAKVYGYAPSFTAYQFITNLPPYGGNCSIYPTTGYALDTKFIISCFGWLNPGEEENFGAGLLYRFWTNARGIKDIQLLYYGQDPYTPESQFALGPKENNFYHDIVVRISNPIGEYVETTLQVQVYEPVKEENVESLLVLTAGESSELSSLLRSGKDQEAKQLIVAVASLINSVTSQSLQENDIVDVDGGIDISNITEVVPIGNVELTTPKLVSVDEYEKQQQKQKEKRTQLRTEVVKTLAKEEEPLTFDSLQQTVMCFKVITHESTELSEEAQDVTVDAMSIMADKLNSMQEESRTESEVQKHDTAEDILECLGNVVEAATDKSIQDIAILNQMESSIVETNSVDNTEEVDQTADSDSGVNENSETQIQTALAESEKVKVIASKILAVAEVVYKTIIKNKAPGEPPVILDSPLLKIIAERKEASKLNRTKIDVSIGSFQLPSTDSFLSSNDTSAIIDTKVMTSKINPFVWDSTAKYIDTAVLSLDLYDGNGNKINVSDVNEDIVIELAVNSSKVVQERYSLVQFDADSMVFHSVQVRSNYSSVHLFLRPDDPEINLHVFVKFSERPSFQNFDLNMTIPHDVKYDEEINESLSDELSHTVFISPQMVQEYGVGTYYIGIQKAINRSIIVEDYSDYYDYDEIPVKERVNYTLSIITSGCFYWDKNNESWTSSGCKVSPTSNSNFTRCLCNHLTSFGADFFVPPNSIDFGTVFTNLDQKLRDNWAVLATICFIYLIYIIGVIWARFKDKRDILKWGVVPLADNVMRDKYFYQMSVYTGMRKGAGTRSKISFVLAGDYGDTGVRQLIDEKEFKTFGRGSINYFVMSVSEWLGPLTFLRIWHDNSGKASNQGWYLSKVVLTDLQTRESYIFLCNRWLAVEEDDGMVDRLLPVAGTEDLTSFQTLFATKTKKSITDSHLWISVFSRPHRSNFTRVQRISCILSLVLTTMMANAMFFQTEGKSNKEESLMIGPFVFSLKEIYISFISSLIVFPVNIIIDQIFRKTKQKQNKIENTFVKSLKPLATLSQIHLTPWKDLKDVVLKDVTELDFQDPISKISETHKTQSTDVTEFDSKDPNRKTSVSSNTSTVEGDLNSECSDNVLLQNRGNENSPPRIAPSKSKSKFQLPHWWLYVGWTMVFLSSLISGFITFLYSMEWGKEKSLAWLSSILLSITESVIVIQPFKIILIAMVLSAILKKPDIDDENEASLEHPMALKHDEEMMFKNPTKALRPVLTINPPDMEKLAKAREKRLNEIEMSRIIREIVFYFVFLTLIVLVASHNRDSRAFQVKDGVANLISANKHLLKVNSTSDFWQWLRLNLMPNLFVISDWNNITLGDRGRRLVDTQAAYRVGPVRLRQQRVIQERCTIPLQMYRFVDTCSRDWSVGMEDYGEYSEGWKALGRNESVDTFRNYPWKYKSLSDNDGVPFAGDIGVYPGGGFVADLIGKEDRVFRILESLSSKGWIDRYTRVIFVEFTIYNPNVNMFTTVLIAFEMPTTGQLQVKPSIKTFRLFAYLGGYGIFVILCEIMSLAIIVYFIVREGKHIRRKKREYFRSFWNCVEILNLCLAFISIVMYVVRHFITSDMVRKVKKLRDKFHNFQRVALWDEVFGYLLAFTVFLSILKLIHLFRFNRKMSMLSGTLKNSAKDVSAYSVVFVVFLMSYSFWGYIMFGPYLESYKNVFTAIETMITFSLGSFDYVALETVSRVFGPIFFFSYFLTVICTLLNVFITILNESISATKKDVFGKSNDHEIVSFIWKRFNQWIGIDFDRLFRDVRRKYIVGPDDEAGIEDKVEDIEYKLDDIMSRLEKLSADDTYRQRKVREDASRNSTETPLFTRIFPTLKRQNKRCM